MLGPHNRTPAPTACGWRTPTARSEGGQSGEGKRLTSGAPHNGKRGPPRATPLRPPHSVQHRPARAHAVGPVLSPHARTERTRDTRVAEPRLPAPEDGRVEEGQRLTPDAPHNGGGPPPPGAAPHHPRGTQPPQGMQAKGTVLGPDAHTPAPTACRWRAPTARPEGRQSGKGERLTADVVRRPSQRRAAIPRGRPSATPTGSNAGPQGRTLWGRCLVPTPAPTASGTHGSRNPGCPPQRKWRPGEGQRLTPDAPHNGGRPPIPGTAPHHPRGTQPSQGMQAQGKVPGPHTCTAAPTTRGWRTPTACPEDGQPGEGQRLTLDATHNSGRPPPPGTAPHHPRGTQPRKGMQAKETVLGPHDRTPAPTAHGWRTPTTRPVGGQSGEGERLTSDAPHNGKRCPPRVTPFRHPHSVQHRPARAHAVGPVLGPRARTDRARDTRVAEPRPPAPEDGRPGEGQRLTPDAPHNGSRPPPPGTAPHHPRGTQPPQGMQAEGTVPGPHIPTPTPTARGRRTSTACPEGGQSGEGERLTPDAPHNGERRPPRVTPFRHPHSVPAGPQGRRCGAASGHTGRGTPAARPRGQAAGGGTAPETRRP